MYTKVNNNSNNNAPSDTINQRALGPPATPSFRILPPSPAPHPRRWRTPMPRMHTPNLHDRPPRPPPEHRTRRPRKHDLPHTLPGRAELAHEVPRAHVEHPHPPVVAPRDEQRAAELQCGDTGVVRGDARTRREGVEGEGDDAPVGAACGEQGCGELQLAHERGVALEEGSAVSVFLKGAGLAWVEGDKERRETHPVSASQMRTQVSSPPDATRTPSNATE